MLMTPRQQIRGLRAAIRHLDLAIDQRKAELVEQQTGLQEGEVEDEEIITLYEMRKQFQADLDRILKEHPGLA
jgi:hypothetical protein